MCGPFVVLNDHFRIRHHARVLASRAADIFLLSFTRYARETAIPMPRRVLLKMPVTTVTDSSPLLVRKLYMYIYIYVYIYICIYIYMYIYIFIYLYIIVYHLSLGFSKWRKPSWFDMPSASQPALWVLGAKRVSNPGSALKGFIKLIIIMHFIHAWLLG